MVVTTIAMSSWHCSRSFKSGQRAPTVYKPSNLGLLWPVDVPACWRSLSVAPHFGEELPEFKGLHL